MSVKLFPHQNGHIAYDDTGSGPLVVCLPSLGDLRGEYRFLAPQLISAGYRVIQADLRGQGASSPGWVDYSVPALGADLLALIRFLDAGPAIVIGTSMSAAAAVWAAAETVVTVGAAAAVEKPTAISRLVLISPAVRGVVSPWLQLLYRALFARPWGPALWAKYYTSTYRTRKPQDIDDYVAVLQGNFQQPGRIEAVLGLLLAPKTPATERLSQVSLPVRVIMGSLDPDFKDPTAEAHWVAEQLGCQSFIVEGAGHYPHAEMPEITGPLVLEFLGSLQGKQELMHVA